MRTLIAASCATLAVILAACGESPKTAASNKTSEAGDKTQSRAERREDRRAERMAERMAKRQAVRAVKRNLR